MILKASPSSKISITSSSFSHCKINCSLNAITAAEVTAKMVKSHLKSEDDDEMMM